MFEQEVDLDRLGSPVTEFVQTAVFASWCFLLTLGELEILAGCYLSETVPTQIVFMEVLLEWYSVHNLYTVRRLYRSGIFKTRDALSTPWISRRDGGTH